MHKLTYLWYISRSWIPLPRTLPFPRYFQTARCSSQALYIGSSHGGFATRAEGLLWPGLPTAVRDYILLLQPCITSVDHRLVAASKSKAKTKTSYENISRAYWHRITGFGHLAHTMPAGATNEYIPRKDCCISQADKKTQQRFQRPIYLQRGGEARGLVKGRWMRLTPSGK